MAQHVWTIVRKRQIEGIRAKTRGVHTGRAPRSRVEDVVQARDCGAAGVPKAGFAPPLIVGASTRYRTIQRADSAPPT